MSLCFYSFSITADVDANQSTHKNLLSQTLLVKQLSQDPPSLNNQNKVDSGLTRVLMGGVSSVGAPGSLLALS